MDLTVVGAPAEPRMRPPRARRRVYADPFRAWARERAQAAEAIEYADHVGDPQLVRQLKVELAEIDARRPAAYARRGRAR